MSPSADGVPTVTVEQLIHMATDLADVTLDLESRIDSIGFRLTGQSFGGTPVTGATANDLPSVVCLARSGARAEPERQGHRQQAPEHVPRTAGLS